MTETTCQSRSVLYTIPYLNYRRTLTALPPLIALFNLLELLYHVLRLNTSQATMQDIRASRPAPHGFNLGESLDDDETGITRLLQTTEGYIVGRVGNEMLRLKYRYPSHYSKPNRRGQGHRICYSKFIGSSRISRGH